MVEHTTLIGISTPIPDSLFSNLVKKNTYLFSVLDIRLICDACAAKNPSATECPHNRSKTPPWKQNGERTELVKMIMESDLKLYRQENLGLDQEVTGLVFHHDLIHGFSETRYTALEFRPFMNRIFIAIDPNGGSESRFGVVVGCHDPSKKLVILYAKASEVTDHNVMEQAILDIWKETCRLYPFAGVCQIASIVESNYGGQVLCSRICAIVSTLSTNVLHVSDKSQKGVLGVLTTNESKQRQCIYALSLFRTCFVHLHDRVPQHARTTLVSELKRFRYVPTKTGQRITGKDRGSNDDLGIAFLLLAFWSSLSMDRPEHLLRRFV